jgi:hypothetical protein
VDRVRARSRLGGMRKGLGLMRVAGGVLQDPVQLNPQFRSGYGM